MLLVGLFILLMRRARGGGAGGLERARPLARQALRRHRSSERRSRTSRASTRPRTSSSEIVDFLKDPDKYRRLGATIPKGVLLSGPPGTGKTLLARAVAGEADVPFFSLSASEFIEMVVGVGASRVRDLFEQAKEAAPVDHLHRRARRHRPRARRRRRRSAATTSASRRSTRSSPRWTASPASEGVIVLAATNRPEILDSALLRPGRFDRRVAVNPPDQEGRAQDPRGPHALGAAGRRRRPRRGRRRPRRAWSAPTCATSSTRRR